VEYRTLNFHQANTDELADFWDDLTPKVANLQKRLKHYAEMLSESYPDGDMSTIRTNLT
jgi:hypothetical protein